jgi:riboflavin kinase/FMN adenylyltransferase
MKLGNYLRPAYGVYAVRTRLPDGREFDGVANFGKRPMFEPEELLEAHLFDFSADLYGQQLEVALLHYLRPEAKLANLEELAAQIGRDADEARRLLAAGAPLA